MASILQYILLMYDSYIFLAKSIFHTFMNDVLKLTGKGVGFIFLYSLVANCVVAYKKCIPIGHSLLIRRKQGHQSFLVSLFYNTCEPR